MTTAGTAVMCRPLAASQSNNPTFGPENSGWLSTQIAQDATGRAATASSAPCQPRISTASNMRAAQYTRVLQHCSRSSTDVQQLVQEFQWVLAMDQRIGHSVEDGQDLNAAARNRYTNVLPYDHNRCKLRSRPDGSSYINASWVQHTVSGAPLRYIATQGPLPDTALHFWQMVVEQGSPAVVMVTNGIERGHVKCAQYWPTQPGEVLQLRGLSVTVTGVSALNADCNACTLRVDCTASNGTITASHHLTHYHYHAWPDHGVPASASTIRAVSASLGSLSSRARGGPVIVHCSAGIGRTGTFCAMDILRHRFAKWAAAAEPPSNAEAAAALDVPALVHELRQQRAGMVQTLEQYAFIYQAAAEELAALGARDH